MTDIDKQIAFWRDSADEDLAVRGSPTLYDPS